jgi:hypothetical protein
MLMLAKRRSDRVHLAYPIQVTGKDANGADFTETGRTAVISRQGAAILLKRKLAPDVILLIRRVEKRKQAEARIVGVIGGQDNEYLYGIILLNPQDNLWDVEFPCLTGSENVVARALLQCGACQRQEVIHFNEIEFEVFDASQSVQRFCDSCSARTLWKQDSQEREDTLASLDKATSPKASSAVHQQLSRRKDIRIPANVSACISQPGFREEIVRCEDVSRGGLCFTSRKNYLERSRVEVSVPYLQKNGNIFLPARIVYVQPLGADLFRHGVAYIKA